MNSGGACSFLNTTVLGMGTPMKGAQGLEHPEMLPCPEDTCYPIEAALKK